MTEELAALIECYRHTPEFMFADWPTWTRRGWLATLSYTQQSSARP